MKRKEFIKYLGAGTLGLLLPGSVLGNRLLTLSEDRRKIKNWAWIATNLNVSDDEWRSMFAHLRESGIHAVLPEVFDSETAYYGSEHLPVGGEWLERLLPIAKSEGLEVHAWIWCMPCNIPEIQKTRPEWFSVNGNGESTLVNPAYVNYYNFLCPSREEVKEFLQLRVKELAAYGELDGIHLDYIRYPDVIIADALKKQYNVVQDREYPQFDYCYCDVCRGDFNELTGIDPGRLDDPSLNAEWRRFRYDSITSLVNEHLVPIARRSGKEITAAVFPNWEHVRQQWMVWNLDGYMPMLYHNFYYGNIEWIRAETMKGVSALAGRAPLYSGLFVPRLNPEELSQAVHASLGSGASGYSVFHARALGADHLQSLKAAIPKITTE